MRKLTPLLLFPVLLVAYEMVLYLANDAYLPALPDMSRYFAVSPEYAQWSLTAFFMGNASLQLLLGPLSERYGRRKVLFLGSGCFILGSLLCAFGTTYQALLIGRFLQGLSVSCMSIAGYATVHDLLDSKQAIKTLSWMNALTVLVPALGPFVGAIFLVYFNFKQLFFCLLILALPIIISLFKIMPETAKQGSRLSLKHSFRDYCGLFTNRVFLRELLSLDTLFAANISWIVAGPFIMMVYFGLSKLDYGISQAFIFSGSIIGGKVIHLLISRFTATVLKRCVLSLCSMTALLFMGLVNYYPHHLSSVIVPLFLLSFTSGMAFPLYHRLGVEAATEPMGTRMAVFSFLMGGSAMVASVLVSQVNLHQLFHYSVLVAVLSCLPLLLALIKDRPATNRTDEATKLPG